MFEDDAWLVNYFYNDCYVSSVNRVDKAIAVRLQIYTKRLLWVIMSSLETLSRQPDFPNEDLHDANVPLVDYYLRAEKGEQPYAQFFIHDRASLGAMHATAQEALWLSGVQVAHTPEEYAAFCNGFAAFEYISSLVNPRMKSGAIAVQNTLNLFVANGAMAEVDLAERRQAWMEVFPNTSGVIVKAGMAKGETMAQLHARAIGAQIASELEMAA